MSIEADTVSIFMERMNNAGFQVDIAAPLVTYIPKGEQPFLDCHPILRGSPDNIGIDFNGSMLYQGYFQVDAVVPDGKGEPFGLRLASQVAELFKVGTQLVIQDTYLRIVHPPTISSVVRDSPWARFPVSIRFIILA